MFIKRIKLVVAGFLLSCGIANAQTNLVNSLSLNGSTNVYGPGYGSLSGGTLTPQGNYLQGVTNSISFISGQLYTISFTLNGTPTNPNASFKLATFPTVNQTIASNSAISSSSYSLAFTSAVSGNNALNFMIAGIGSYTVTNFSLVLGAISSGPSSADTQSSVNYLANQLQSSYAIQSSLISNGLTYDCAVFDKNGICISAGAGYTAVNSGTPSVGSGLLIGGYKLNDQVRLGAWVNQKAYNTGTVGLNAANSNPMFGLYAVWNQEKSGNGLEVRASAGYETNSTTSTRQVFGTSEAGVGTASLTTQGIRLAASYNIPTIANLVASPYVGVRYTKIGLGGYTESSGATTPLTYGDLNQENTTVLAGVKLFGKVASKVGVFGSVGVEQDIQNNAAAIQASGSGQTLTNASLTSSYQATRPVATAGAYYELDKAQRVTFNAGYTQSMYMPVAVSSAYVTYTAGF